MCGIAGFVATSFELPAANAILAAMTESLHHRGPADSGLWTDLEAGTNLGHCRLAVVDVSETRCQSMASADGCFAVTYNGKIYNFTELRAELLARGHSFRGGSDTVVLVEAFSAWGVEKTMSRLHGMFAFGAWNRRERVLTLAHDRMGEVSSGRTSVPRFPGL